MYLVKYLLACALRDRTDLPVETEGRKNAICYSQMPCVLYATARCLMCYVLSEVFFPGSFHISGFRNKLVWIFVDYISTCLVFLKIIIKIFEEPDLVLVKEFR